MTRWSSYPVAERSDRACSSAGEVDRQRVSRLVQTQLAAAWDLQRDESPEAGVGDWSRELHATRFQVLDRLVDVVAHQVQLVPAAVGRLGRVDAKLTRG